MSDPLPSPEDDLRLAAASALGGGPADALGPLDRLLALRVPSDGEPADVLRARWLSGVALGALGRYEEALAALAPVLAEQSVDRPAVPRHLAAAACATAASLLRQIGDHAAGDPLDQRGLALTDGLVLNEDVPEADAPLDCLVGSTADAVGLGELDLARQRLERTRAAFADLVDPPWRPAVRLRWVETEVALLAGEVEGAASAAATAVALAEAAGSPRHTAKSAMFAGVATALLAAGEGSGDGPGNGPDNGSDGAPLIVRARTTLIRAADLADRHGLLPLAWPVRAVLATLPGLALDAEDATRHLALAAEAARAIAAGLPPARVATWTARDPMAAHLLTAGSSG